MEWILENGDNSKIVQTIEDIATEVKNVMEGKSEFLILSPSEPIRACNFMQATKVHDENLHFEVSLMQPSGKTHVYYKACSPNVAICLLTLFYTENAVPDTGDWTFSGGFG